MASVTAPNANVVNIVTNVIGFLLAVAEPIRAYVTTQPFNWLTFTTCVLTGVIAWYTGKSALVEKKVD